MHLHNVAKLIRELREENQRLKQHEALSKHALSCVDRVFQQCRENPNPILPDFCGLGEDKFRAVIRLAEAYKRLMEMGN